MDLMGAALKMIALEEVIHHETHVTVDRIAQIIQKEAKDQIGTYQEAIGPYPAWAELAESTKRDRVAQGYTPNDPLLRSGKMRDSIERHSESLEAEVGSNDDIAVYQELGTAHIPPRPFIGPSVERAAPEIERMLGHMIEHVFRIR